MADLSGDGLEFYSTIRDNLCSPHFHSSYLVLGYILFYMTKFTVLHRIGVGNHDLYGALYRHSIKHLPSLLSTFAWDNTFRDIWSSL